VPPVVSKEDPNAIELRRKALEFYLNRLLAIGDNPSPLMVFLEYQDNEQVKARKTLLEKLDQGAEKMTLKFLYHQVKIVN